MAGENDVFTVLGQVKVDQQTLDASLATTEAKVRASADRQGQTWKKASEDAAKVFTKPGGVQGLASSKEGQWWSDPNLAGFADKAAGSVTRLGEAGGRSVGNMRALGHIIGALVPGMGGMAISALQVAAHLGFVAAAILVAVELYQKLTDHLAEVTKEQNEFARAVQLTDVSGLTSKYEALADEVATTQTTMATRFRSLVNVQEESVSKLLKNALGMKDAYFSMSQEMERASKIAKILANNAVVLAQEQHNDASTARELTTSRAGLAKAEDNAADAMKRTEKQALHNDVAFKKLWETDDGTRVALGKLAEIDKKYAAEAEGRGDRQARRAVEDARKAAELAAARIDSETKRVGFEKEILAASQATTTAEIESKRQLEIADAAFNARRIQGTDEYLKTKQAASESEVELERRAAEASFDTKRQKLTKLISEGGPNKEKYRIELDDLAKEEEKVYTVLAEKKKQIDIQSTQEAIETRKKEIADKIALADKDFSYRVALGQRSFAAEIQQAKEAANDSQRTHADRDVADIRQLSLVKEANAAYFALRKAMGQETIYGEIAAQKELNKTYAEGSRLLIEGQTKVLNLQRQAREEAKSAYLDIAGEAAAELRQKSPGKKKFTASEVEKQADKIRERREDALGSYLGGGKADITDAFAGLSKREEYRKLDQKGGLSGALSTAVSDSFNGFAESTDQFGGAVLSFRNAVDALAGQNRRNESVGAEYLQDPSMNKMSEKVGRQQYLENKRGPVQNTSASEGEGSE